MTSDHFTLRLAAVRQRFATRLAARIASLDAMLPQMQGATRPCAEAVARAHHQLHELCGLAPALGFPATGRAARAAEEILRAPRRAERALTTAEAARLREALDGLRAAARAEPGANGERPQLSAGAGKPQGVPTSSVRRSPR